MLSAKIKKFMKSGMEAEPHVSDEGIRYYVIECPDMHIAIWPHWTVACCKGKTKRRFYLFYNPAFHYAESYEYEMDKASREQRQLAASKVEHETPQPVNHF